MSHWLHPEAEGELTEAAVYLAEHASAVIANAYLNEFERVVAVVEANGNLGTPGVDGLRVFPFRRFPYSIIYRAADSGPQMYAVSHQKRAPGYWRSTL